MKFTNKYDLPESIALALMRQDEDYSGPRPGEGSRVSVTGLVNPPIVTCLREQHRDEIEEDVSDGLWRMLGTACHWAIEKTSPAAEHSELRLEAIRYGLPISGQLDNIAVGWLNDYKATSVWAVMLGDKPEWEAQLNCYDWLARQNGIEIENGLRIIAILRDWRKSEYLKDPARYPPIPIMIKPVRRWSEAEQEDYVLSRIEGLQEMRGVMASIATGQATPDDLTVCSPDERWQKPTVWAVYRGANKRAAKLADSETDAYRWIAEQPPKDQYRVEERPSRPTRCLDYCEVRRWCPFGAALTEGAEA